MKVPEATRLAALAAAAKLRERAASVRPDEELSASITANAAVGDEFARAYAALRELGLDDRALDRFGVENATPLEMRDAADLLERLALSESAPGRRKSGLRGRKVTPTARHRFAGIAGALVLGVPVLVFAGAFFWTALPWLQAWRLQDRSPVPVAQRPSVDATQPLSPATGGFVRTPSNELVPAKPRNHVTDRAGVLSDVAARTLNARLVQFERETSNQVLVFVDRTVPPETTMMEMTAASLRAWGVGQKGKDNGAIFFVFVDDRKMRIEVGYGLESVLTDARSKRITSQIVKPLFQQGKLAEGIEAGALAVMDVTRGGDAALANAEAAAQGVQQVSIVPALAMFALAAACLALALYIFREFARVFRGESGSLVLGGDRDSSRGGSSSDGGSSSGSSDSFSGGGGSGGGGGASDSW
jgi:uncharacterized protein